MVPVGDENGLEKRRDRVLRRRGEVLERFFDFCDEVGQGGDLGGEAGPEELGFRGRVKQNPSDFHRVGIEGEETV